MVKENAKRLLLIDQFCEWLQANGRSENTIKTYRGVLDSFDKWLVTKGKLLKSLTKSDVQDYVSYLELQNKSASTIGKMLAAINVFSRFLGRSYAVQDIQVKGTDKQEETAPEYLTSLEREQLLIEIKRDGNLRDIAIVYLLMHTGIRVSELCALNRADIAIKNDNGTISVRSDKGFVKRIIPLSQEVREHLGRYLSSLSTENGPLFKSSAQQRMSTRAVQYMLKKYDVNPHKLRHTFCYELINNGVDLLTVAQLAGHSDINTTRRYLHSPTNNLEEAINLTFM